MPSKVNQKGSHNTIVELSVHRCALHIISPLGAKLYVCSIGTIVHHTFTECVCTHTIIHMYTYLHNTTTTDSALAGMKPNRKTFLQPQL